MQENRMLPHHIYSFSFFFFFFFCFSTLVGMVLRTRQVVEDIHVHLPYTKTKLTAENRREHIPIASFHFFFLFLFSWSSFFFFKYFWRVKNIKRKRSANIHVNICEMDVWTPHREHRNAYHTLVQAKESNGREIEVKTTKE